MDTLLFVLLLLFASHAFILRTVRFTPRSSSIDLFAPHVLFPVSFAVIYGGGILHLTPYEEPIPTSQFATYFLSLASFFVGVYVVQWLPSRPKPCTIDRHGQLHSILIGILLASLCIVAAAIFIRAGNPLFASNVNVARTAVIQKVGGWMYYVYRTLGIIFVFYAVDFLQREKVAFIDAAAGATICAIVCFLILSSGYRGQLLTVILTIMVAYHYQVSRMRFLTVAVAFLVLAGLFSAAGALRSLGSAGGEDIFQRFLLELQTPAMSVVRIADRIPRPYDYLGVRLLLYPFLSLMPGEQLAYGLLLKEIFQLKFEGGGFVPSLVGGFYLIRGLPMAYMGLFSMGALLSWIYATMLRDKHRYTTILYAYMLVYFLNSIRGGLLQEILPIWYIFLILAFRWFFARRPHSDNG